MYIYRLRQFMMYKNYSLCNERKRERKWRFMMDILIKKLGNAILKSYVEKNLKGIDANIENLISTRTGDGSTEIEMKVKVNVADDQVLDLILKKIGLL